MGIWVSRQYNAQVNHDLHIPVSYRGESYFLEKYHNASLKFSKDSTGLKFIDRDGYYYIELTHNKTEKVKISVKPDIYGENNTIRLRIHDAISPSTESDTFLYPWSDKIKAIEIKYTSDEATFNADLMEFRD